MADRKATNKYIPPDFDPKKHKSINSYRNSHPLRERARKLDQGILVVRFEMPFNVWCLNCDAHIGAGVRYNAEKKKVGSYYSTSIMEFQMKCHLCSGMLVIRTDPENRTYKCVSGVRKKVEDYEISSEETGQKKPLTESEREKMDQDAFYRLEHLEADKANAIDAAHDLDAIKTLNERQWKETWNQARKLRNEFKEKKKNDILSWREDEQLKRKFGLGIDLLSSSDHDGAEAKKASIKSKNDILREKRNRDRLLLEEGSIFNDRNLKMMEMTRDQLLNEELKRRKIQSSLSNSRHGIQSYISKRNQKTSDSISKLVDYDSS